jgi:hypothetical protein
MEITKTSVISGKTTIINLDITEEQYNSFLHSNQLIQNVFPNLSKIEREFLISGMSEEEQIEIFGK